MQEIIDDSIKIRSATNADCESIQRLVFGVLAEYVLKNDPQGTDLDIADVESNYLDRGGVFEVLEDGAGKVVGTIGLYPLDAETIELRKMYLAPELRGRGLGRKILSRAIEKAKNLGYLRVYLETAFVLKQAVHLYESFGFSPVEIKHTPRCDQGYMLELQGK